MTPVTELTDDELAKECDAARYFADTTEDIALARRANALISECEKEMDRRAEKKAMSDAPVTIERVEELEALYEADLNATSHLPQEAANNRDTLAILRDYRRMREKIAEALGCFGAADVEGWRESLAEGDIERIRDIWERRISFAERVLEVQP